MRICLKCLQPIDRQARSCSRCSHQTAVLGGHLAFAPELAQECEGFESSYFAALAEREDGNFWFRSRNKLIIWALKKYFPEAGTFLEIGCGTGFVLSGLAKAVPNLKLSGSEVYSAGLSFAAQRVPTAELFQMDARCIPFREEFDVIGAFDVIEHIEDDEDVLSQMHQATRRNGGILLTAPHHRFLWSPVDEYSRHVRRYRTKELRAKIQRAGFRVVRTTSFVSLLMPLLILSRWKQRLDQSQFDPAAEYKLGAKANALLESALNVEAALIKSGPSLPFGGSLLMAARKD